MDQCTHEVRAEYWRNIIKACGQRPAGQSAKKWMDENGICEQSYYHWQRKFRQQAYDQMKKKKRFHLWQQKRRSLLQKSHTARQSAGKTCQASLRPTVNRLLSSGLLQ